MKSLLAHIERVGNKIPHPSLMFLVLCIFICLLSLLCSLAGVQAINPTTNALVLTNNLLSDQGLIFILTKMVSNFIGFAPVGIVLVAMLGLGIAERSGLLSHLLLQIVHHAKGKVLTFLVAFAGIMSSIATDSGYVILLPLSALMFKAANRPAISGIATSFAGVSAGFGANLLIGPFDAVLAGISTESAKLVSSDTYIAVTCNWIFSIVSTFFLAAIITVITEKRDWASLGAATEGSLDNADQQETAKNTKGLLSFSFIYLVIVGLLTLPESAILRNPATGSLTNSPFIHSIVVFIALYFAGLGIIFGFKNQVFKKSSEVIHAMEETMGSMAGYLVMMFFAAQFVAYFNWSNLGLILSIKGATALADLALPSSLLLVFFIGITCFVNLFIGSGSAKWTLLAPIFVPMLMMLNIPPETTQMAYRIGDSSTNIISPMMPYFALALSFLQRYQKNAGMGTLLSAMLPYSIAILIGWTGFFLIWLALGWPLGI